MKIREISLNDYEQIRLLLIRNGLCLPNKYLWESLWKENPEIRNNKTRKKWPVGWVLENDNGRIVGNIWNILMIYKFKGKKLIAAISSSWTVDKSYRAYSIPLHEKFFKQKDVDTFIATTANYTAGRVLELAFKAKKIPFNSYNEVMFWITNYHDFVKSFMIKKDIPLKILSCPISLGLKVIDNIRNNRQIVRNKTIKIREYHCFDQRFDAFWKKLKNKNRQILLCIRNSGWLEWHYKNYINTDKLSIFCVEKNREITAYGILRRADNPRINLTRMKLVDLQTIDNDKIAIEEIIKSCIEKCKREKISIFEIIGFNSKKRNIVEKYNPLKRELQSWPFFYKANNKDLDLELENSEVWDICEYDGDASLM